ncbi:MAG: sulfate transporter CysZ [Granulosicoccus sp.]
MNNPGFLQSASYVATGWRLVRQPGLRRFVLLPLLVNLAVFGVIGWWVNSWATSWLDALGLFSQFGDWWIVQALQTVLHWLVSLVLLFSLAFVFTLVANLIGAPFNGLLAERVEAHLVGEVSRPAPSWLTLVKSVPRLMGSELSKLIYLLVCITPLLLLQFVPLINLVAPILLFLFGAWMFALEYMDYPLGNHGALFRDVRRTMRKRRRVAYGFGSTVALLSTVPLVNLFIMPVAVAGATALYVDYLREDPEQTT